MRNFIELIVSVSQDADQLRRLLDLDTSIDDSDAATASTFNSTQLVLAASAADVVVAFGGVVAASTLILLAYEAVSIKINGSSVTIPVRPVPAITTTTVLSSVQKFDQPGVVYWRGRITSLSLTNPSSTATARVFVALVGEAAA